MSFFGDDAFDDIMKEFLGGSRVKQNRIVRGEQEERVIDFIEDDKNVFFVFELPGYSKDDVSVEITKHEIEISAIKNNQESIQPYLKNKLQKGVYHKKELPSTVKYKKHEQTFNNGVLEVKFKRK